MKFLLFYLARCIRRRPLADLAALVPAAIAVFCLTTLTVDLASRAAALPGDELRFDSANFGFILALHVALLLASTLCLTADRRRRAADEYAILSALGVGRGRLIALELLTQTAAFLGGSVVGLPLAVGGYAAFAAAADRALDRDAHAFALPIGVLALGLLLLFAAALIGTLFACLSPQRRLRLRAEGCFDGRPSVTAAYRRIARRRRPPGVGSCLVAAAVQLLPLLLLIAAFSLGPIADPDVDFTVGLRDYLSLRDVGYRDSLIPAAVCDAVAAVPGAQLVEARPADDAPGCYTQLRIAFDDATRADGLAALDAMAEDGVLARFRCINRRAEVERRRIDRAFDRLFFGALAMALLPMALLLCTALRRGAAEEDDADMATLYALGLPPDAIRRHYHRRMAIRALIEVLPPLLLAGVIYNIMEVEGGGSRSLLEPLAVGLIWLAAQLILAHLTAEQHIRRGRSHEKEALYAHSL